MNTHPRVLVLTAALLGCGAVATATAGCKQSSADSSGPTPDPSACTFHHASPKFCMVLPGTYAGKPETVQSGTTELEIRNGSDSSDSFLVHWSTPPNAHRDDTMAESLRENEKSGGTVINDDGKGGYWYDAVRKGAPGATYHSIYSSVKGPAGRLECIANGVTDATQVKTFLAACRSLRWE